jgi:hypothetical protein
MAIVGNGNVACDVARIMLKKQDEFGKSDIPSTVLQKLAASNINCVSMIGRRGLI